MAGNSSIIDLVYGAILILLGLVFGRRAERKHYARIIEREAKLAYLPVKADSEFSPDANEAYLVVGEVVVANDSFKSFVAAIKNTFGGRLKSFETLLDRGRREAVLRLKERAADWQAKEIVHLRIHTAVLDTGGVEIIAMATALK